MSAPVLIYLGVTTFAVILALWAIAASLVGDTEIRGQRVVAGSSAVAMLLCVACVGGSTYLGYPRLLWGTALLPVLTLAITWSNLRTVSRAHGMIQVLLLPIFVYNLLLIGIYTTWFCSECLGIHFGVWGASLLAAFAQAQTLIGHPDAMDQPLWLHVPIVVPPWAALLTLEVTTLLAACAQTSFLVLTLLLGMPLSFARTESFAATSAVKPRYSKPLRIHVPWGEHRLDATQRTRLRLNLQRLRVAGVSYTVRASSFTDPVILDQLKEEIAWARSLGHSTMALVAPPQRYAKIPAASLDDLRRALVPVQTQAAKVLTPDHLVLFSGPYGSLRQSLRQRYEPREWYDAIRRTLREVRPAHPETRMVVAFERFDRDAVELFQVLDRAQHTIDEFGIVIRPAGRMLADVRLDLERIQSLCDGAGPERRVHITACGGPLGQVGGEVGQWNLCARVLQFSDQVGSIRSVAVATLFDPQRMVGILSHTGRPRRTFVELVRDADHRPAGPGR